MFRNFWISALAATAAFAGPVHAGVIFVTSTEQKISATGGCSLQEAIAAANYDDNIAIQGYDSNDLPLLSSDPQVDVTYVLPDEALEELSVGRPSR